MKYPIPLMGFAYADRQEAEVYLKLASGKYLKMSGKIASAKRHHGRFTRGRDNEPGTPGIFGTVDTSHASA